MKNNEKNIEGYLNEYLNNPSIKQFRKFYNEKFIVILIKKFYVLSCKTIHEMILFNKKNKKFIKMRNLTEEEYFELTEFPENILQFKNLYFDKIDDIVYKIKTKNKNIIFEHTKNFMISNKAFFVIYKNGIGITIKCKNTEEKSIFISKKHFGEFYFDKISEFFNMKLPNGFLIHSSEFDSVKMFYTGLGENHFFYKTFNDNKNQTYTMCVFFNYRRVSAKAVTLKGYFDKKIVLDFLTKNIYKKKNEFLKQKLILELTK